MNWYNYVDWYLFGMLSIGACALLIIIVGANFLIDMAGKRVK